LGLKSAAQKIRLLRGLFFLRGFSIVLHGGHLSEGNTPFGFLCGLEYAVSSENFRAIKL
jgi:hypothetical protein